MRTWVIRGAFGLLVVVGLLVAGFLLRYPVQEPIPEIHSLKDAETIARGRYLTTSVAVCVDCHSERDWSRWSGPPTAGTEGGGGDVFDHSLGFPGRIPARNITPNGLEDWSDGEIARAITRGMDRENKALFPVMPYSYYASLCDQDLAAIVAYLRTLPPIENKIEPRELDFPVNLIVRTLPGKNSFGDVCAKPGTKEYGKYLTTIAGCAECHTERSHGDAVGPLFAGGWTFQLPSGEVTSSNITPHQTTGIGRWTKEGFISRFRNAAKQAAEPGSGKTKNTVMPWSMYAQMTDEDLGAIFDHLMSLEPVERKIVSIR